MTTILIADQPHNPVDPALDDHPLNDRAFDDRALDAPALDGLAPDDPAQDGLLPELAEQGLRRYTARVAAAVGTGPEAAWCEWADAPSAYIPLDHKLPGYPDRDAALIWAAEQGWAVAAETGCGEDLLITASLPGDVLPAPHTVAEFTRTVLAGRHADARGRPSATVPAGAAVAANVAVADDLARRLVDWVGCGSAPDGRNN